MQRNGRRHGRAALAAIALGVAITATTGGASTALTLPDLPVQPPKVPPLPALPDVPTTPAPLPQVKAPSLHTSPRLQPAPSLPSGGGSAPTAGSAPAAGAAPPATAGAPAGAGGGSNTSARVETPAAGVRGSSPRSQHATAVRTRQERRFRRAARRLEPCLFAVAGFERRVIVLRGGYGGRRPLSRTRVARRLGASVSRVRRAERRALGTLRTTSRTQGCLGSAAPAVAVLAAPPESGGAPPLIATGGDGPARLVAAARRSPARRPVGSVLSAHASRDPTPTHAAVIRPVAEASGGPSLGIALGLLALVFVAIGVSMVLFARRRSSQVVEAAPAEAGPVAAPVQVVEPPPPAPAPVAAPEPPAPAEEPAQPTTPRTETHNIRSRTAVGLAASAVSIAAGYLLRRRRR